MASRLLFVYLQPTSFVRDDLEALSERYELRPFHFDVERARRASGLAAMLRRQLAWLVRELPEADAVFGWFADYHMVLPTLLGRLWGKPVAVSLGGFDGIHLPELGYGVFHSRWRGAAARLVHRRASVLLPVAEALIYSETAFSTWPERRANGVRVHVPGLRTPYQVVPTGYDPEAWPMGPPERDRLVSTVALLDSDRTLRRKGVDLLIEAARLLPDVAFEVVGVPRERQADVARRYRPPANVRLLPPQPRQELPDVYGRASVYAQLSRAEGMPNVLCEAMLCGCIPVASDVFGNPAAVGDAGFLVGSPAPEAIAAAIEGALASGPERREQARSRIATRFTRERRYQALGAALDRVAAASGRREAFE